MFSVHSGHDADQRPDTRQGGAQVLSLVGDVRPVDLDEADVVRPRVETQLAQPRRIQRLGGPDGGAITSAGLDDGGMVFELVPGHRASPHAVEYI
ncbi:hypothetical protein ACWD26_10830 [Streptomyces sp. NPDC002787]